jgi:hypothetical protein
MRLSTAMTDDAGYGVIMYKASELRVNDVVTIFLVNDVLNVIS